jgi:hypothetical protein
VDPVEIVNLIRRDFASSRWVAVLLALLLALGTMFWLPVRWARGPGSQAVPRRPAVSVLPDPFDGQQK